MARTLQEETRPRLARSFRAGYRPPLSGPDALLEGEALIVVPDNVMCFGLLGGGAFAEFDLSGGGSGPAPVLSAPATVAISGHTVVRVVEGGLAIASSADMGQFGAAVGISTGFAESGASCAYVANGPLVEPSWSWAPGPVFLGADGALTQQEPASGFLQQIGVSDLPTRLLVDIQPPFALGA